MSLLLAAAIGGARIDADHLVLARDCVDAQGHVRLILPRGQLAAARLRYDPASGELVLSDARFSPCTCTPPLWELEAHTLTVRSKDRIQLRGGWLRVGGTRVLPLPRASFSLADRRTGLLVPAVSWGRDGVVAEAPVEVVLGPHADLRLSPEWRQARGVRALWEGRASWAEGEGARLGGAIGREEGAWRGALGGEHAWTTGLLRTAAEGRWTSDGAYLSDFGDDFLARAAPWNEQRALVGVGPLRLVTDRYQAAAAVEQLPIAGALTLAGRRLGPVGVGAQARLDTLGSGAEPLAVGAPDTRLQATTWAQAGHQWSLLRVSGQAELRGADWLDGQPWAQGRVGAQVLVPTWGDLGGMRHIDEVGFSAAVSRTAGQADVRLPGDLPAPAWAVGPVASSRWITGGAVPLRLSLGAPWTPDGWRPGGAVQARRGAVGLVMQGDTALQQGRVEWHASGAELAAELVHVDPLLQARLRGVLPVGPWRLGWQGLVDVADERALSQGPTVSYSAPCGCLGLDAAATWSVDRALPDVGVQLRLR